MYMAFSLFSVVEAFLVFFRHPDTNLTQIHSFPFTFELPANIPDYQLILLLVYGARRVRDILGAPERQRVL